MHFLGRDYQGNAINDGALLPHLTLLARHDYLPFGEEISAGTGWRTSVQGYAVTDTSRQRYAMLERDYDEVSNQGTGLDHAGWRKYDSSAGRWTSADPYNGSISLGNPQSFNRYTYVSNDPVNKIDPSGLEEALVRMLPMAATRA